MEMLPSDERIKKLQEELEKTRAQFYIFYELTRAMRTTLRLDEIVYIILTGLTAHQGLSFNRAILFLIDEENKAINGFMGIGTMDTQEANNIWHSIEDQKMDLYDLISTYNRIKEDSLHPKFMEFAQSLSFPLKKESGIIFDAVFEKGSLHLKETKTEQMKNDPLIKQLTMKEFLISCVWIKDKPSGIIVVDNCITRKPITDEDVRIFNMFVEQAAGAIENSQAFENTLVKSHTDMLTGLWNYGYFQYKLDEELMKARSKKCPLSVLMIDLDDFKKFNDSQGHVQGDEALRQISDVLKDNARPTDILCRYGGEEFSIIMPNAAKEEAQNRAEIIRQAVASHEIFNHRFTVSIGLSSLPSDDTDKSALVEKADEALYQAKRQGKNQVVPA
jgi:diguanylate cyclase (GGDEF)-like protein